MSLEAMHAKAIILAGSDFRWTHPDSPSTVNSAHRKGLADILSEWQDNRCAACGDILDGNVQICHIVASRVGNAGMMPGNIYIGHAGCNDDDAKLFGDIVPLNSLSGNGTLVPLTFPTRAECVARARRLDMVREERRQRRLRA